jgi:hypothetical protein
MFPGKFVIVAKVQPIATTQIVITNVNVVDVNVTTRSKVTEEQVFNDRKPKKQRILPPLVFPCVGFGA